MRPVLSARIHYANRTTDNALRHAVFKGLREAELSTPVAARRASGSSPMPTSPRIWVTNPTRRLFGKSGPTKLDIAVYYAAVGDFMLPHILGRPVSLVRCPTGKPQDCFFQRHAFTGMPASVATFETDQFGGRDQDPTSRSRTPRAIWRWRSSASSSSTPGARPRKQLDKPDRIIFDLDPGEGIAWREIVEAAVHIRGELEALGLVPFVKTSGGKGIHVVVPVTPKLDWKKVHRGDRRDRRRGIAATRARHLHHHHGQGQPQEAHLHRLPPQRAQRTAAAPYSLRARTNLPASTPVTGAIWNPSTLRRI